MQNAEMAHGDTSNRTHAFDPQTHPALFDGVLSRRFLAFLFDAVMIVALMAVMSVVIFIIGILTLSLGWALYAILFPLVALPYTALTLGGHKASTPGMRLMGLEMRLWYGDKPYGLLAIMHAILFWVGNTILTPFIILVGLFSRRSQLLHDMVLGTMVMDKDALWDLENRSNR